ncbi:MAG: cupin domain-containing protein [Azoarcus sp.]|jgi:quercetin dioxygenase-like cupin family protein|nr:cupin domain-containing protein [Azoarcus sp.]
MQNLHEAGKRLFAAFEHGEIALPENKALRLEREWIPHTVFKGVALKHVLTAADTDGAFSYHLVRIEPDCMIGQHNHATQCETHEVIAGNGICQNGEIQVDYRPGVIAVIKAGTQHTVEAQEEGLLLFAKFIPPLL